MRLTRTRTLGIRVDSLSAADVPLLVEQVSGFTKPVLFTFANPGCVAAARRDPAYPGLLDSFDAVLPDGIGLCWAMRMVHGLRPARVSFDTTSLAPLVFDRAQRDAATVALVGGRPGVAQQAARQLQQAFPGLRIVATLDGYGAYEPKVRELSAMAPSVVVCGMGVGAQERFLLRLAEAGWCGRAFTCGGYLDQLAAGLHYYPPWADATNLRWAYRLAREPRRLARRYGIDYGIFAARLALAMLHGRDSDHQRAGEA